MTAPAPRAFGEGVRVYAKPGANPDAKRVHKFLNSTGVNHVMEEWNEIVDLYLAFALGKYNTRIHESDVKSQLSLVGLRRDFKVLVIARRGEEDIQFLGASDELLFELGETFSD